MERFTFVTSLILLSFLAIIESCKATSAVLPTRSVLPTCTFPRSSADPSSSDIANVLKTANATGDACNAHLQGTSVRPNNNTFYILDGGYFFNTTSVVGIGSPSGSACTDNFQSILNACVLGSTPYWGGWVVVNSVNYSIGNPLDLANPLLHASSSVTLPSGATVLTVSTIFSGSPTVITETFVPTTYSQYATLQSTITTTSINSQSSTFTVEIGPGGIAWTPSNQPTGQPELPPPDLPPSNPVEATSTGYTGAVLGHVITSSAKAPSTQSAGALLVFVTTSYNPSASVVSSITPDPPSNTVIYTSDGSHPPGSYPFIRGGPGCLFCPPGVDGGGIIVFGMGTPGIYPPPTPAPFPSWPTITIGNNLVPTPSSVEEECSVSKVVTDCEVVCAAATAATTTSCTTTCSAATTDCSGSGTTTTSFASGACNAVAAFATVTTLTTTGDPANSDPSPLPFTPSTTSTTISSTSTTTLSLPTSTALFDISDPVFDFDGGSDSATDIFICVQNLTLEQIFAPGGTPVSNGKAKNDEAGWGTWQGGGCECVAGQFCCDDTARVPISAAYNFDLTVSEAINPVDYYKHLKGGLEGGACSCNGPVSLEPRNERTHLDFWDPNRKGRTVHGRRSKQGTKVLVPRVDHSPTWTKYAPSGLSYYQNWQAKTGADRAPFCTFEDNYDIQVPQLTLPPRALRPLFTDLGVGIAKNYYYETVTWPKGDSPNADFTNQFSPVDGVIIAAFNDRQNLLTGPACPDNWSEIAWRLWTRFCETVTPGTTDYSGLRYVFQSNINNAYTNEIIEEALAGVPAGQVQSWTPEDTSLDNAFWPLLGSPNGNGIIYILTDHKVALNGKGITKISAMYDPADGVGNYVAYMWATIG